MSFDMDVRSQKCARLSSQKSIPTSRTFLSTALLLLSAATLATLNAACGNKTNQTVSADSGFGGSSKGDCDTQAIANRYIVRWKDGTTSIEDVENAMDFQENIGKPFADDIEFAETDFRIKIPKQPQRAQLESFGSPPVNWGVTDSRASEAWSQGATGEGIIVAVVDTGADETHPQLASQLYVNPGEIAGNQVDDDHNGFVDDVSGFDFVSNTGRVIDHEGHGTHVAGIIAADSTKGIVQGMAPKAKIMPLAFMDADGGGTISASIQSLTYAQNMGAKIVSASWGGSQCSKALKASIQDLNSHGILFIAAAGNGDVNGNGLDIGLMPEYPAALGMPNQITVAAISVRDVMASFSNFSTTLVNIAAPGMGIISTYPGGGTVSMNGTSMATPFVSGAAAAIWSAYPNATAAQVRAALVESAHVGNYPVTSSGRLDVTNALALLKTFVQN